MSSQRKLFYFSHVCSKQFRVFSDFQFGDKRTINGTDHFKTETVEGECTLCCEFYSSWSAAGFLWELSILGTKPHIGDQRPRLLRTREFLGC